MEIKSKTRVAAKPRPALRDTSGPSPCGQSAHCCPSPVPARRRRATAVPEHPPLQRQPEPGTGGSASPLWFMKGQGHHQSTILLF